MSRGALFRASLLLASLPTPGARFLQRASPYDFGRDAGKIPKNVGDFKPESAGDKNWLRDREIWRRGVFAKSIAQSVDLNKLIVDDANNDTFVWANLSDFKLEDSSVYWDALCNGTNMTNNTLPGDIPAKVANVTKEMADWSLTANTTCVDFGGTVYKSLFKANKMCGTLCDGIMELGCSKKEWRVCKLGSKRVPTDLEGRNTTDCVYRKPLRAFSKRSREVARAVGFKLPKAMLQNSSKPAQNSSKPAKIPMDTPRMPQELDFWKSYCKFRVKGRKLRVMFEGRNCADSAVKELGNAGNHVECADLAAKDPLCADVFDFTYGPPTKCRCQKKGKDCAPAVATAGHVFGPSL